MATLPIDPFDPVVRDADVPFTRDENQHLLTTKPAAAANPKHFTGAKPRTHQGNLKDLHPAIVNRLVPLPNWVNWKWELNEAGTAWTKEPYQPNNLAWHASVNNKTTWGTHEAAVANVEAGKADGIGFCLFETNICAFDIDNCRDPINGAIDEIASALVARCGVTYAEVTVSGTGLRIIGLGGTKYVNRKQTIAGSKVTIESYRYCPRYITISGMTLKGVRLTMSDLGTIDAVLTEVVDELDLARGIAPGTNTTNGATVLDDDIGALIDDEGRIDPFLEGSLPEKLLEEIRVDAPIGKRSEQFFHAVKWLKDLQWSPNDIIAMLNTYPDGIAAKYVADDRLADEALRAYGKPEQAKPNGIPNDKPDDYGTRQAKAAPKLIQSSEEFTRDFVPPDYLLDGVLIRGYVYSFTARTGDGKTAVALALSAAVALNREFAGREVAQGRVLYFAGENPDDVRMRWIAMAQHLNFDSDMIEVSFIPGVFKIPELESKIRREVAAIGGVILVIIDTSPAYFAGESENDRKEMQDHAEMTRRLHNLRGAPTVITLCHPVKGAADDKLVPAGGGSFLNAMDGNLCATKSDTVVKLHHQGKFRGVEFEPISFELLSVTARKLLNAKGQHMPTVIALDLSGDAQREKAFEARFDEDAILLLLHDRGVPTSSTDIAKGLHWLAGNDKHPNKSKVQRVIKELMKGSKANHLVETDRDGTKLTKKGEMAAIRLAAVRDDDRHPSTLKVSSIQPETFDLATSSGVMRQLSKQC